MTLAAPRPTRTRQAYDTLRAMIMDGDLVPGESHLETDLAARLNISRTPLREAALKLEADGFVEVRPRLGIRISSISARDMAEIYDILAELEPLAAETLARKGLRADELDRLATPVAQMDQALATGDLDAWAQADRAFHTALIDLCENRRLSRIIGTLRDQVHRARMATLERRADLATSNRDHRDLVDLIVAGDSTGARRLHRRHRMQARHEIVALLERMGGAEL